jgi:hypothetical protein
MQFAIWQVKHEHIPEIAFRPFDPEKPVRAECYHCTYAGELKTQPRSDDEALQRLFHDFNVNQPTDFRSYSLSMADIVILDAKRVYYCDSIGWLNLKPHEIEGSFLQQQGKQT